MPTYYPSQGSQYSHHGHQPVVYTSSSHGHGGGLGYQYAPTTEYYGHAPSNGGAMYVPTHSSHRSHRHRHHHHTPSQVVTAAPQVVMQPSYYGGGHHNGGDYHHHHLSFGERVRRFFGLAPRGPFKYRSSKGSWGFLGYSRRQRYTDARTGAEVDRKGRPVYRV